jgi:hypothetical protein
VGNGCACNFSAWQRGIKHRINTETQQVKNIRKSAAQKVTVSNGCVEIAKEPSVKINWRLLAKLKAGLP